MTKPDDTSWLPYGQGDNTYQAAGGQAGIRRLVDCFYDRMGTDPAFQRIHDWHPDETLAREKLALFLCGWMGGPRLFRERFGTISIPLVHAHLPVTAVERDMWLACMQYALAQQPDYPESLKVYLLEQLAVPAERVRQHRAALQENESTSTDGATNPE